jgi:triosephosphate isomerase (TIM)
MSGKPLVVGNWKMNTTLPEAEALTRKLKPVLEDVPGVDVVLCPPFPWLTEVKRLLDGANVQLGAQNFHYADGGAFTGEVSLAMLKGVCRYVLVGQYERRIFFDEKDGIVRRKLDAALKHGFAPILCVGETADELDEGQTVYVLTHQLETALEDGTLDPKIVIAYEPVWTTIGMVSPPPLSYVNDMCAHIRETLGELFSPAAVEPIRIIYGGSTGVRNAQSIASEAGVDGVLVGAGAVNPDTFVTLVRAFAERHD